MINRRILDDKQERSFALLFCCLAAIHTFILSAAFPFFNNVDEPFHFDLIVKYSQGKFPKALDTIAPEAAPYLAIYDSMAYFGHESFFPRGEFPPPTWTQPIQNVRKYLLDREAMWLREINYEATQPPLYYMLGGTWWRVGKGLGFTDGRLLYWLRFLNCFIIAATVWVGYLSARKVFQENLSLRLAVPALIAFFPQTAFFSVGNDLLSALCFGIAFLLLLSILEAEQLEVKKCFFTGLALAATFLAKLSNLPLLVICFAFIAYKIGKLATAGRIRAAVLPLLALSAPFVLPLLWMFGMRYYFGDFLGSEPKLKHFGILHKPFVEWFHHPIFSLKGVWTFVADILDTFWQGEFWWHRRSMNDGLAGRVYASLSLIAVFAGLALKFRRKSSVTNDRWKFLFCFLLVVSSLGFFGFLSMIYDFGDCPNPSRVHPFFHSGRLMLGILIPFLILFVYGFNQLLQLLGLKSRQWFPLVAFIVVLLIVEITAAAPAFANGYNWFHL